MKKILLVIAVLLLCNTVVEAQIVGQWKDNTPFAGSDLTLHKAGNTYHIEQVFLDGSKRKIRVNKIGNKYSQIGSNDYYIVDTDGNINCYDNDGFIYKAQSVSKPSHALKPTKDKLTCYDLGVRFGRCATLALKGKVCDPKDDIAIPPRCRGSQETQRGIEAGVKSVY